MRAPIEIALNIRARGLSPDYVIARVDDAVGIVVARNRGGDEVQDDIIACAADVADVYRAVEACAENGGTFGVEAG